MNNKNWWRSRAAVLALGAALAACSKAPAPDAGTSDPYAGGVSYPWSDRTGPDGSDPYVGGTSYPWVGAGAPSGLRAADMPADPYLSDLQWTEATNAWGPVEKDRSVGGKNAGDGRTLTIGGQTFEKGLGVHANSEVSYALGGGCSVFTATIGVDDGVGDRGSVVFQVWNGNTKLFDSGVVRGTDAPRAISVPVNGVAHLRLVVTDAGNGISYDHANWASAQVGCPPRVPAGDSFLSDLPWSAPSNAWGPIEKDQSNGEKAAGDGRTLTIGGQTFAKGLGMHANGSVTYTLGGRCSTFTASVGVDDAVGNRGSVLFQVFGDGTERLPAVLARGADGPQAISVDMTGVNELRLVVTDAGDGRSYDHADWADAKVICTPDASPPSVPTGAGAVGGDGSVTLDWADNTETDLAGYRVLGAPTRDGPFQNLTPQPVTDSAFTESGLPEGVTRHYQIVAVDQSGNVSLPATASATTNFGSGTPQVSITNLDGAPWNDRLVFSRIGTLASPPSNGVHDVVTLRISNGGSAVLRISALPITGPWQLQPSVVLPIDVAPGASTDVPVRFVAEASRVNNGSLTVVSNDPATPNLPVQLAGLWQRYSESGQEPDIFEIRAAFGYQGSFLGGERSLNQKGLVRAQGDEVLSAYWQRADETQPINVRQLAAYHTQGATASIFWHPKTSSTTSLIFRHAGVDGQTLSPRLDGLAGLAVRDFTPGARTFGFKVDGEWSDPVRNSQSQDRSAGCLRPCGQHVRFYPAKDRAGLTIPNTYFMFMDYSGINYDYNDNAYLISNIKPAPILYNVGAAGFTSPAGEAWLADKDRNGDALYTPATAINEPTSAYSGPITGTDNPVLYRSYRGRTSDLSVPQENRQITFDLPINNGTYQVKLHFAEHFWQEADRRRFDVLAEGVTVISKLDIYAESGGRYAALVKTLDGVQVNDGKLTLTLNAGLTDSGLGKDFPSLSGIEVVR